MMPQNQTEPQITILSCIQYSNMFNLTFKSISISPLMLSEPFMGNSLEEFLCSNQTSWWNHYWKLLISKLQAREQEEAEWLIFFINSGRDIVLMHLIFTLTLGCSAVDTRSVQCNCIIKRVLY